MLVGVFVVVDDADDGGPYTMVPFHQATKKAGLFVSRLIGKLGILDANPRLERFRPAMSQWVEEFYTNI